jgi:hypothetical protein
MELFKKYFSEVESWEAEETKVIFDNKYLICSNGKIFRLKFWNKNIFKEVKQSKHNNYLVVGINGKQYRSHRLIAKIFIPNPNNLPQINHKDGNKLNNNISNLEWCTPKENINHAWGNNLCRKVCGKEHHASKKVYQYDLQGNFIKDFENATEIEKVLNFNKTAISKCCTGVHQTSYGYIWKYERM